MLESKKETADVCVCGGGGYKKRKKRITTLICSNATGNHKFKLTLIGNLKKPRAFKKPKNWKSLPVYYTHQRKHG